MIKNFILLILSVFLFQTTNAQTTKDTLLTYHGKWGRLVYNKDSAEYFTMILPEDTVTHISSIKEYFSNGKPKLIGTSKTRDWRSLYFEGPCISYYANGKRKEISNYINNKLQGYCTEYFPNGKIYFVELFRNDKEKLIECRDTSNNVLTKNGNGKWIMFDDDVKHVIMQGEVVDSLKNGEWDYLDGSNVITENIFKNGDFISGVYFDKSGNEHKYTTFEVEPTFEGGPAGFNNYLAKNVKYPKYDKDNKIEGRVIVMFVVEKDGSLTTVKALRAPDQSLGDAAVQAIQLSPAWTPGIQNGQPVRVQYTIAFGFKL